MIEAIIVDDELYCCEALDIMVKKYCPSIKVMALCQSAEAATDAVQKYAPGLVFLDIEMPHVNGFDWLKNIGNINFELIFTTSYDQYAIKAIKWSAMDYLLKPIGRDDLLEAAKRVEQHHKRSRIDQLTLLLQKMQQPQMQLGKIALPTKEGLIMIEVDSIISCAAHSNYTHVLCKNKQKHVVSRTLKEIEDLLDGHHFQRVHHSFLINLNEISKYVKGEGGYLVMSDSSVVEVSRSRKEMLMKRLNQGG
ncbi:MAG: response regulator transcription factor [Chitinophagaceae bacterium]|nr:response regulator transcription factor [Chitinophagaceae bacterium]